MLKHFLEVPVTFPVTEPWETRFVMLASPLSSQCCLEQILTFLLQGTFHRATLLCVHLQMAVHSDQCYSQVIQALQPLKVQALVQKRLRQGLLVLRHFKKIFFDRGVFLRVKISSLNVRRNYYCIMYDLNQASSCKRMDQGRTILFAYCVQIGSIWKRLIGYSFITGFSVFRMHI